MPYAKLRSTGRFQRDTRNTIHHELSHRHHVVRIACQRRNLFRLEPLQGRDDEARVVVVAASLWKHGLPLEEQVLLGGGDLLAPARVDADDLCLRGERGDVLATAGPRMVLINGTTIEAILAAF